MLIRIKACLLFLFVCSTTGAVWAKDSVWPNTITVITDDQRPVAGLAGLSEVKVPVEILNLDAVSQLERRLSQNLPTDPKQAKALASARLAEPGSSTLKNDFRKAYQAILVSMRYQLDRYPVIIFDEQTVIYGVTNLPEAIRYYRQWRASHREVVE